MQNEFGIEDIKTLLAAARLAGPALRKDPLLIFEGLLQRAETPHKGPGGAESAEPSAGLRLMVRGGNAA